MGENCGCWSTGCGGLGGHGLNQEAKGGNWSEPGIPGVDGKLGCGAAAGEAAEGKELPTKQAGCFYHQPCDSLDLTFLRGRKSSKVFDCCFLSFDFLLFSWLIGFIFVY